MANLVQCVAASGALPNDRLLLCMVIRARAGNNLGLCNAVDHGVNHSVPPLVL